jgi:hypothetical protein
MLMHHPNRSLTNFRGKCLVDLPTNRSSQRLNSRESGDGSRVHSGNERRPPALELAYDLRDRMRRRNRDQHMHTVRHRLPFFVTVRGIPHWRGDDECRAALVLRAIAAADSSG